MLHDLADCHRRELSRGGYFFSVSIECVSLMSNFPSSYLRSAFILLFFNTARWLTPFAYHVFTVRITLSEDPCNNGRVLRTVSALRLIEAKLFSHKLHLRGPKTTMMMTMILCVVDCSICLSNFRDVFDLNYLKYVENISIYFDILSRLSRHVKRLTKMTSSLSTNLKWISVD